MIEKFETELARDLSLGTTVAAEPVTLYGSDYEAFLGRLPAHSPIRIAAAYWNALTDGGRLPARHEIDPIEVGAAALPHLVLVDVEEQLDRRIRYRLVGTAVVRMHGSDYTGRYMDDISYAFAMSRVGGFYRHVAAGNRPGLYNGRYTTKSGLTFTLTRLAAPLRGDDPEFRTLLCTFEKIDDPD